MNAPAPAYELVDALTRATAALDAGDSEAASADLEAAADLCHRLQTAGIRLPAPELARLRELYERFGVALVRIGEEVNAAGFRDEQQRRGLEAYHSGNRR
jgi:hypothetical protein